MPPTCAAGTYTLRGQGGAGDAIAHPPAVSLPRVLELAGVSPDALSFVSIRRPNGTLTVLRAGDLARPAPFPEGPPLVWLDADSVRFLRPVRDDADVNGADNIATAGEDLVVRVQQGPLLQVALRIAPAAPRAGERAHLEARVTGAQPGAALTVRWRFGDGTEATGAAVSHRWRTPGVYAVVASADGDDDSGGASEPLVVRVGAPRERREPRRWRSGRPRAITRHRADRAARGWPAPAATAPPPAPTPAPAPRHGPLRPRGATGDLAAGRLRTGATAQAAAARAAPRRAARRRAGPRRPRRRDDPRRGGRPARGGTARRGASRRAAGRRRRRGARRRRAVACSLLALGAWRERRRRRP